MLSADLALNITAVVIVTGTLAACATTDIPRANHDLGAVDEPRIIERGRYLV